MFDVEIVIFDVGKDRPRQPELLLEHRPCIFGEQLRVFFGDALALGRNFRGRPLDFMPFLTCEM